MQVLLEDEPTRISAYWKRHSHIFRKDTYECAACHAMRNDTPRICPNCFAFMEYCLNDYLGDLKDVDD